MHKYIRRINAPYISGELCPEFCGKPDGITQMVVAAVAQYNEMSQLSEYYEGKDVNERLMKEAEEESVKVFLDGILDIMQRGNS